MATIKKATYEIYARVNGVSVDEVKVSAEMTERLKSALLQVARYPECYPGETEEKRDDRLEMVSADNGEVTELAYHLRTLNPEYKNKTAWEVIFLMQNYLDGQHEGTKLEETQEAGKPDINEAETEVDALERMNEAVEASSENNTNKNKEEQDMAESATKTSDDILAEEQERVNRTVEALRNGQSARSQMDGQQGAGTNAAQGSMPDSEDSGIRKEIAMEQLLADRDARIAMSYNAKVVKVVFSQPTLEQRLVAGNGAKGTIKDVENTLKAFEKKVGAVLQADGSYMYDGTAVPAEFQEDVKQVHKALLDAKSNAGMEFSVYIGTNGPSIRGVELQVPGDDKNSVMTVTDLLSFMYNRTAGQVDIFADEDVRAVVKKIGKKATTVGSSTGRASVDVKQKTNPFKGHVTVGWSSRYKGEGKEKEDLLLRIASYHKDLQRTEKSVTSGPKSDLKCKIMTKVKQGTSQKLRPMTYRIPLVAEQYKTEVVSEEYRNVFGDGLGIGKGTVSYDLKDPNSVNTLFTMMADGAAVVASSGISLGKDDFFSRIRETAAAREAKQRESDAKELEDDM